MASPDLPDVLKAQKEQELEEREKHFADLLSMNDALEGTLTDTHKQLEQGKHELEEVERQLTADDGKSVCKLVRQLVNRFSSQP